MDFKENKIFDCENNPYVRKEFLVETLKKLKDTDIKVFAIPFDTRDYEEDFKDFLSNYKFNNKVTFNYLDGVSKLNLLKEINNIDEFSHLYKEVYGLNDNEEVLFLNSIKETNKKEDILCFSDLVEELNKIEDKEKFEVLFNAIHFFNSKHSIETNFLGSKDGISIRELVNNMFCINLYGNEEHIKALIIGCILLYLNEYSEEDVIVLLEKNDTLYETETFKYIFENPKKVYIYRFN